MWFKQKFSWMIIMTPFLLFTGCGDLEPNMQDKRSVILKMDFHGKTLSRSNYIVSQSEISEYNTHLILALPSNEHLTISYKNYFSSFAKGLMNPVDNKVSLEIPVNTQMKIFTFLFKESYSIYDLYFGDQDVVYFGESSSFSIISSSDSLSLGITLQTELEGSWKTDCYTYSDNTYSIETVTIEGNVLRIKYEIHSDTNCITDYVLVEESHILSSVGDVVTFSNGKTGREFTVIIGSTQNYTPQSALAVSNYSSVNECGTNDWQLNTEKECSNADAGDTVFCLYQLDGNYLYPSCDSSSTPSTSTVNTEDVANTFVKQ